MEQELRNSGIGEIFTFLVGTYTEGNGSRGIYKYEVAVNTGNFRIVATADFVDNPSYLALSPDKAMLYAVSETAQFADTEGGGVAVFDITGEKISLRKILSSGGRFPCHVTLDPAGRYLFAANYGDGAVAVYDSAAPDGLTPLSSFSHQELIAGREPHAHFAAVTPDGKFLCVVDLGLDAIVVYSYDEVSGAIAFYDRFDVTPGSGPRHLVFSADGRYAYVVHELSSEVEGFAYGAGRFAAIQKLSTLPAGFNGTNSCAAIRIAADGTRLYASNRGDDSIAVFHLAKESGRMELAGIYPCGGRSPRDFILLNDRYLLAANQTSGTVTLLAVDETGALTPVGKGLTVPGAVCVRALI